MTALLAALHLDQPDSLKRALASLFGFLSLVLVNPLLAAKGLPTISDANIAAAAAIVATFVAQSGANSIAAKKAAAADAGTAAAAVVTTEAQANAVLAPPKAAP